MVVLLKSSQAGWKICNKVLLAKEIDMESAHFKGEYRRQIRLNFYKLCLLMR